MRRVWLRATALALVVVTAVAGLTVYFSTDSLKLAAGNSIRAQRVPIS